MKFIASIRSTDGHKVHLCVQGHPEKWATGKTLQEAMKTLSHTHREVMLDMNIRDIEWNRDDQYTWLILAQTNFSK